MSIRATNFVRGLRGFSGDEKSFLYSVASHCGLKTELCTASMSTLAVEAGLAAREVASRIASRLAANGGPLLRQTESRGRVPAVYRMNYAHVNRDAGITVARHRTVTHQSRLRFSNRDAALPATVTQEGPNRDATFVETQQNHRQHSPKVLKGIKGSRVGKFSSAAASSSSERGSAQPDDDPGPLKNGPPQVNGNGKPKSPVEQKPKLISAALRSWAHAQILARSTERVRNKSAYLKAAETEFFENLPTELELFYTECAQSFLSQCFENKPDVIVPVEDVHRVLLESARTFGLPTDPDMLMRAIRAAGAFLDASLKPLEARVN